MIFLAHHRHTGSGLRRPYRARPVDVDTVGAFLGTKYQQSWFWILYREISTIPQHRGLKINTLTKWIWLHVFVAKAVTVLIEDVHLYTRPHCLI